MERRLWIGIALSVTGFASLRGLAADQGGFEFQGLRLGTAQAQVAALIDFEPECPAPKPPRALDTCHYERQSFHHKDVASLDTVADEPIDLWTFRFADGRLGYISVLFPHDSYRTIKDAMLAKYGKPSREYSEALEDASSGISRTQIVQWERGDEILRVKEYVVDVKKSVVTLASISFLEKRRRRQK